MKLRIKRSAKKELLSIDSRVIYSIDTENREVIIEGVRKKDKKTYK